MNQTQVTAVLAPVLSRFALDLDALEIVPAGKRRLLRVVVDGDGPDGRGPVLDDLAEASKAVSIALDASDVVGSAPYTLELTSRGVSRPLELPRHWRRNAGRLVSVRTHAGDEWLGRIVATSEDSATLDVAGTTREVAFAEVAKAVVQVEFTRAPAATEEE